MVGGTVCVRGGITVPGIIPPPPGAAGRERFVGLEVFVGTSGAPVVGVVLECGIDGVADIGAEVGIDGRD